MKFLVSNFQQQGKKQGEAQFTLNRQGGNYRYWE
jgi:hypothetical protein